MIQQKQRDGAKSLIKLLAAHRGCLITSESFHSFLFFSFGTPITFSFDFFLLYFALKRKERKKKTFHFERNWLTQRSSWRNKIFFFVFEEKKKMKKRKFHSIRVKFVCANVLTRIERFSSGIKLIFNFFRLALFQGNESIFHFFHSRSIFFTISVIFFCLPSYQSIIDFKKLFISTGKKQKACWQKGKGEAGEEVWFVGSNLRFFVLSFVKLRVKRNEKAWKIELTLNMSFFVKNENLLRIKSLKLFFFLKNDWVLRKIFKNIGNSEKTKLRK